MDILAKIILSQGGYSNHCKTAYSAGISRATLRGKFGDLINGTSSVTIDYFI